MPKQSQAEAYLLCQATRNVHKTEMECGVPKNRRFSSNAHQVPNNGACMGPGHYM